MGYAGYKRGGAPLPACSPKDRTHPDQAALNGPTPTAPPPPDRQEPDPMCDPTTAGPPPGTPERRMAPRYAVSPGVACELELPETGWRTPAILESLGAGSAGVFVSRPPEPGAAVLRVLDGPTTLRRARRCRVATVRALAGGFFVGLAFDISLSVSEVSALLAGLG
jgi:hypothetical protein